METLTGAKHKHRESRERGRARWRVDTEGKKCRPNPRGERKDYRRRRAPEHREGKAHETYRIVMTWTRKWLQPMGIRREEVELPQSCSYQSNKGVKT